MLASLSPLPTEVATPTAEPSSATFDPAHIPAAPAGDWSRIHWVAAPNPAPLPEMTADPDVVSQPVISATKVVGWSKGFVAFSVTVIPSADGLSRATIRTSHSPDGVNWKAGASWGQSVSVDNLELANLYEGPSGLLAVGFSGACGTGWIEALWTSSDGATWSKVDMQRAFGGTGIEAVSGGSAGFVAAAQSGAGVWTSRDGRTWHAVDMKAPAFKASRVDTGTAFSGGFVLAGSTELTGVHGCGATTSDPNAPATPAPPLRSPSVWWSADGTGWAKEQLPGADSAYSVSGSVYRLNDHALLLSMGEWGPGEYSWGWWVSSDGRTWSSIGHETGIQTDQILTDGRRSVQVIVRTETAAGAPITPEATVSAIRDDGSLVQLAQSGEGPMDPGGAENPLILMFALGPTGIVASDGTRMWLGIPS